MRFSTRSFALRAGALLAVAGSLLGACGGGNDSAESPAQSEAAPELVATHSPVVGPGDAAVTLVEFFDPACEGCAAFYPTLKSVLAEFPDDVRLVYRYLAFHKGSDQAVGILEAARAQGRFEAMVDALLTGQHEWASHGRENLDAAWRIAEAIGLDMPRAREVAASPETKQILEQDLEAAIAYRIQQTPTLFVNGEPLESYDLAGLRARIAAELGANAAAQ